jgi:cell division protein FtsI (penicillin-binding protein 3)
VSRRGDRRRPEAPRPAARSRRIRLLAALSVLALAVVGMRAAYLGTVRADDLSARATDSNRESIELIAQRGSILSADGRVLATDDLTVDVTASPDIVDDPVSTARDLGRALGMPAAEIEPKLHGEGQYSVVARGVAVDRADAARRLGLAGVHFEDTYERFLPGGPLAAQIIGLTGADREGLSGLEAHLDAPLTGTPGSRVRVRDAFGRTLRVAADRDPVAGADVGLTLNSAIQDRTERILTDTLEAHGAVSAMAVVMDPRDGAILAMATVPGYDPNSREDLEQERTRNRPVTDMFEPGSTFKIVTMTGALEDGVVEPDTPFFLPAVYPLYDREIKESHRDYDTTLTATQILEQSSNVGSVKIAQALGKDRQIAWMERFGFGSPTGMDFPGESAGYLRPSAEWFGFSIGNIPIGQGVSVTLGQLARAYSAIANGGTLVTPRLVTRVGDAPVPAAPARRIVSRATAGQVDRMLRGVVSDDGTGTSAQVRGYEVAGKTGTAQKYDDAIGTYSASKYSASFVGYLPADDPQLVIAVMVDEPTAGSIYGGDVAAPAFERIAEFAVTALRIEP